MNLPIEPRMYLILREDLSFKYIQGAHGLAQYALNNPTSFRQWDNGYLICLSVFNGLMLEELRLKFRDTLGFPAFGAFYEPDLKSELPTAICVFDDGKNCVREHLKGLSLATK